MTPKQFVPDVCSYAWWIITLVLVSRSENWEVLFKKKFQQRGSHPLCGFVSLCAKAAVTSHPSRWRLLPCPCGTPSSSARWPERSHTQTRQTRPVCQTSMSDQYVRPVSLSLPSVQPRTPLVYSSAARRKPPEIHPPEDTQRSGHCSRENKMDQINNFHPSALLTERDTTRICYSAETLPALQQSREIKSRPNVRL